MREGLRRVSAVFWGFWVVFLLIMAVASLITGNRTVEGVGTALPAFIAAALAYGAHRLTCWVIDGFFAGKRT